MTVKLTMFLQLTTAVSTTTAPIHRVGGWSESWYYPGNSIPSAIQAATQPVALVNLPALLPARAALLPTGASITGQRYQIVSPPGPSQSTNLVLPGTAGILADIPQMALLCSVPALNANNIRKLILRGIPDVRVVEGEYSPSDSYQSALLQFFFALSAWQFRGRDLAQPTFKILTIDATGKVTTEAPNTLTVGTMVRILRSKTADGDLLGGRFQVATTGPGNTVFTINGWGGEATTGGTVRVDATTYLTVNNAAITIGRIITRRVGRPFGQYRGRHSIKKG